MCTLYAGRLRTYPSGRPSPDAVFCFAYSHLIDTVQYLFLLHVSYAQLLMMRGRYSKSKVNTDIAVRNRNYNTIQYNNTIHGKFSAQSTTKTERLGITMLPHRYGKSHAIWDHTV